MVRSDFSGWKRVKNNWCFFNALDVRDVISFFASNVGNKLLVNGS